MLLMQNQMINNKWEKGKKETLSNPFRFVSCFWFFLDPCLLYVVSALVVYWPIHQLNTLRLIYWLMLFSSVLFRFIIFSPSFSQPEPSGTATS